MSISLERARVFILENLIDFFYFKITFRCRIAVADIAENVEEMKAFCTRKFFFHRDNPYRRCFAYRIMSWESTTTTVDNNATTRKKNIKKISILVIYTIQRPIQVS